ncbi:iron chelate uptake ABC transporter family permease subunit [Rossellomorea marisflavi]|uniref:Iron ABC transporter n=2 Tax=Rossellomorea marisflavi TaxID=189381 RepID=A0A0J5TKN4_9BACI|nr:iron ABC transporter [Rossellomorea marisflavi]KML07648.1 iron ABC transporter [Rossellomorea marisflavi]KML30021.1 iron ABC transporter [Rossellomorea marisflavi]KZE48671.1 iron ABC transporter [Rossellomorea marisflavi]QHA35639.1 iron chelate uptake ABC transporter family permease subunit [Rossellomorea marisflavi]
MSRKLPYIPTLSILIIVLCGSFLVSVTFGAADTTLSDVWGALTNTGSGDKISILQELRFPREVAAILVGAALSVSGAIMQGMTRNPLADPGLLGLTAGANAALAAALAFLPSIGPFGIMLACFIGAAVGAGLVFGIGAVKRGGFSPFRIVLAGAAVSAFLFAVSEGIGLYFKLSKDISMWTAGGLIGTTWNQIYIIGPCILLCVIFSMGFSRQLTILSLNEEVAVGLGQRTVLVKSALFLLTVILAGSAVALVGNMAFLGLMVPHIARALTGTDYRTIIPVSVVLGSTFMLLADTIGRTVNAPYETPVAAIVSLMGLPFFLFIVRKGGKL